MDISAFDKEADDEAKRSVQYRWTEEKTLQFILHRHQRTHLFNKKRNTSKAGWQGILNDMGISQYVTHHQAQKKWNNLWSRYKSIKKGLAEGEKPGAEDLASWPFFEVMDAIATGNPIGVAVTTLPPIQSSATDDSRAIITSIMHVDQVEIPTEDTVDTQEPLRKKPRISDEKDESGLYHTVPEGIIEDKLSPLIQNLCHEVSLLRESIESNTEKLISAIERVANILHTKDIIGVENNR